MMLNGKEWSAKAVHLGLDRGWDEQEFISHYALSGMEELRKQLKILYKYDKKSVNFIMADMKRNRKKNKKKNVVVPPTEPEKTELSVIQNVSGVLNTTETEIKNCPVLVTTKEENENKDKDEALLTENSEKSQNSESEQKVEREVSEITAEVEEEASETTETELDRPSQIKAKEEEIDCTRRELAKIEKERKKIISDNREASKRLKSVSMRIEQLEAEILNLKAQAIVNSELILETPKKLMENKSQRDAEIEKLKHLEEELQKLNVKTLCCDCNTANREKNFDYYLDDITTDSNVITQKTKELMENDNIELVEEFSIKELKRIAKIILTAETVEGGTGTTVQLFFDEKDDFATAVEIISNREVNVI